MTSVTAFNGTRQLAFGPIAEVAVAVRAALEDDPAAQILTFDDATGRVVDLDLRGAPADIRDRYAPTPEPRSRGRPKLGVQAREVTLLPRHWEWLAAQPGGASAALRRLIDEARKRGVGERQLAQERAYRFMNALAGNLPGFEEATRALFAADWPGFEAAMASWPGGVRAYAISMAAADHA